MFALGPLPDQSLISSYPGLQWHCLKMWAKKLMESSLKLSQEFIGPRTTVTHASLQKVTVSPFSKDGCKTSNNSPNLKKLRGLSPASELYRQSGRRRSAKLVPTFADRGVSRGQRNGSPRPFKYLFSRPEPLLFIQVAPQLTSQGWVDPVPDPLLLRKSGSAGNRTRDHCICSQKLWPLDNRGGQQSQLRWDKCILGDFLNFFYNVIYSFTGRLNL